jgi:dipeptidyl aminopeptidase/acylaminoacyl peptidase
MMGRVVVGAQDGAGDGLYAVDLRSGQMDPLLKPTSDAELKIYDPSSGQVVFTANTGDRLQLWLVRPDVPARLIVETNAFLKEIAKGNCTQINYRGLDGQDLKAWLLLPVSYEPGKRYPTIAWVYAGRIVGNTPVDEMSLNWDWSAFNLQLLASRGYMVLVPSMPLKPEGEASDPYMELTKGVLPALDKAIELGYVDPNRLGVMGSSFGGFSTYGLVTQTNRFKAAISHAGISDFVSLYGTFDPTLRYEDFPTERLQMPYESESGQFRLLSAPWEDLGRYIRNSPISYVERVQTPLMIVQGDMDFIAMQQGEEFFTALYRQGKRARFIRYWGEGHGFDSPANTRDFWHKAFAWFDEFLDISRDSRSNLIFDVDHVKSRNGAPPLKPQDFERFDELELKSHPWVREPVSSKQ